MSIRPRARALLEVWGKGDCGSTGELEIQRVALEMNPS